MHILKTYVLITEIFQILTNRDTNLSFNYEKALTSWVLLIAADKDMKTSN